MPAANANYTDTPPILLLISRSHVEVRGLRRTKYYGSYHNALG